VPCAPGPTSVLLALLAAELMSQRQKSLPSFLAYLSGFFVSVLLLFCGEVVLSASSNGKLLLLMPPQMASCYSQPVLHSADFLSAGCSQYTHSILGIMIIYFNSLLQQ
jgi:hypothetical protein